MVIRRQGLSQNKNLKQPLTFLITRTKTHYLMNVQPDIYSGLFFRHEFPSHGRYIVGFALHGF